MSRFGPNRNPITSDFMLGQQTSQQRLGKRVVDGLPHVCADGHNHASEAEVVRCIEAHKVFVCSSNHMHTERSDGERCDQIKREGDEYKDRELARKHEREMCENKVKMVDNLRTMGWNFKVHGMPQLQWKDS